MNELDYRMILHDKSLMSGAQVHRQTEENDLPTKAGYVRNSNVRATVMVSATKEMLTNVDAKDLKPLQVLSPSDVVLLNQSVGVIKSLSYRLHVRLRDGTKCIIPDTIACKFGDYDSKRTWMPTFGGCSHSERSFPYHPGQILVGCPVLLEKLSARKKKRKRRLRVAAHRPVKMLVEKVEIESAKVSWKYAANRELPKETTIQGDDLEKLVAAPHKMPRSLLNKNMFYLRKDGEETLPKHLRRYMPDEYMDLHHHHHVCPRKKRGWKAASRKHNKRMNKKGNKKKRKNIIGQKILRLKSRPLTIRRKRPRVENDPETPVVVKVKAVSSSCDVVWEDGSFEADIPAANLVVLRNYDRHRYFPGQFVMEKDNIGSGLYGVVQAADNAGKVAKVTWFRAGALHEGEPTTSHTNEMSFYDIAPHWEYSFKHDSVAVRISKCRSKVENIGMINDQCPDGRIELIWPDGSSGLCWPQELITEAAWRAPKVRSMGFFEYLNKQRSLESIMSLILDLERKAKNCSVLLDDQMAQNLSKIKRLLDTLQSKLLQNNNKHLKLELSGVYHSLYALVHKTGQLMREKLSMERRKMDREKTQALFANWSSNSKHSTYPAFTVAHSSKTDVTDGAKPDHGTNEDSKKLNGGDDIAYIEIPPGPSSEDIALFCEPKKNSRQAQNEEKIDNKRGLIEGEKRRPSGKTSKVDVSPGSSGHGEKMSTPRTRRSNRLENAKTNKTTTHDGEEKSKDGLRKPTDLSDESGPSSVVGHGCESASSTVESDLSQHEDHSSVQEQTDGDSQLDSSQLSDDVSGVLGGIGALLGELSSALSSSFDFVDFPPISGASFIGSPSGLPLKISAVFIDGEDVPMDGNEEDAVASQDSKEDSTQPPEMRDATELCVEIKDQLNQILHRSAELSDDSESEGEDSVPGVPLLCCKYSERCKKRKIDFEFEDDITTLPKKLKLMKSQHVAPIPVLQVPKLVHRRRKRKRKAEAGSSSSLFGRWEGRKPTKMGHRENSFLDFLLENSLSPPKAKIPRHSKKDKNGEDIADNPEPSTSDSLTIFSQNPPPTVKMYSSKRGYIQDFPLSSMMIFKSLTGSKANVLEEKSASTESDEVNREKKEEQKEKEEEEEEENDDCAEPPPPLSCTKCGSFKMLTSAPQSHKFRTTAAGTMGENFSKTVGRELNRLRTSLPAGLWVAGYEDRMDLYSVMVRGPEQTPYEDGLFLFDVMLPPNYPHKPPLFYYHSFCSDRLNPNLYNGGKVCLSLLGTWPGHGTENWSSKSTLLQVLVSIQGLILVKEPFYNEPLHDSLDRASSTALESSRMYNELAILLLVRSMTELCKRSHSDFEEEIKDHFKTNAQRLIDRFEKWLSVAETLDACGSSSQTKESEANEISDTDAKEQPQFPLLPLSRGFCLSMRNAMQAFKAAADKFLLEK